MSDTRIKVVIADDEAMIRKGIERLVASHGEEWDIVGSFKNGKELLECYEQTDLQFDLLITDVKMPVIDGLTLMKELKQLTAFEAIVISGFDDFAYLQTAIREGAVDYILKPIDRDELFMQLSKAKQRIENERLELQELEEIKRKASNLDYATQTRYFSEMIWRQYTEGSRAEWSEYGFLEGTYILLYLTPDYMANKPDLDGRDNPSITSILEESLHIFCRENSIQYWLCEGEHNSYWILFYKEQNESPALEEDGRLFAKKVQWKVKEHAAFTISVAMSPALQDLALLSNSKYDLHALAQFRLVYGGNQIFEAADIHEHKQVLASTESLDDILYDIVTAIERLQKQDVEQCLALLFAKLKTFSSPKEIEKVIQSLCIQILYFTIKAIPLDEEADFKQEGLSISKRAATLSELQAEISAWIMGIIRQLSVVYKSQNVDQLLLAKRWIQGHLHENITIERIAKEIYMNPTYFCELFKNQTGETVLDYITKVRMQKAQELLLRTDLKVYEIAQKVGYSDTKYFSKLFKRHLGELPSKYKEQKLN